MSITPQLPNQHTKAKNCTILGVSYWLWAFACKTDNLNAASYSFPHSHFLTILKQKPLHSIRAKLRIQPFNSLHFISHHAQTLAGHTARSLFPPFSTLFFTNSYPYYTIFLFGLQKNASTPSASCNTSSKLHGCRVTPSFNTSPPYALHLGFRNSTPFFTLFSQQINMKYSPYLPFLRQHHNITRQSGSTTRTFSPCVNDLVTLKQAR